MRNHRSPIFGNQESSLESGAERIIKGAREGEQGRDSANMGARGDIGLNGCADAPKATVEPLPAYFSAKKGWKYRRGWEVDEEFRGSLDLAIDRRNATFFELLVEWDQLLPRLQSLAEEIFSIEQTMSVDPDCQRLRVRWMLAADGVPAWAYLWTREKKSEAAGKDSLVGALRPDCKPVTKLLRKVLGKAGADAYLEKVGAYLALAKRVRTFATLESPSANKSPGREHPLRRWMNSLDAIWTAQNEDLKQTIDRFMGIDAELSELAFEFNFARQPIRYRSIICRPDIDLKDPLGPGCVHFRVVSNINRESGKRQTRDVPAYKAELVLKKIGWGLKRTTGVEPSRAEIKAERSKMRTRAFSPWITDDLLAHCHLGKHRRKILQHQEMMAALMTEWAEIRARLKSLL